MALSKSNLSIIIIAFATLFLDAMNYALIVPVLPTLVQEFNSTSFQQGILYSSYSVFQLISTYIQQKLSIGLLIAGPLSDKYGRKPFLILSLIGSCLGMNIENILFQRFFPSSYFKKYVGVASLEINHGFVCWISYSCSGVVFNSVV